jgi:U3 small nucleolar RNA-associated protein MPP10
MPARKKRFSRETLEAHLAEMAKEMGVDPSDLVVSGEDGEFSDEEDEENHDADGMDVDEPEGLEDEDDGLQAEGDEDEAITRLKSDLFEDDGDLEDQCASVCSHNIALTPYTALSRHEKRQKALAVEIAGLEQENIGKKDWSLTGEARAKDRPINSLLEQDLEFEHVGKLVPTVTAESTQSLEDKIKSRIINEQWDDVERKLEFDPKAFLPSQLLEISATQSGKSLAELYADEYSADRQRAEGKDVVDERDTKLKSKHAELESMFESICSKLDALSNTHFTPKAVRVLSCADSNS